MTIRDNIKHQVRWRVGIAIASWLGQAIAMPTAFRLLGPQVKFCPFCGVSLDEPMEPGP